MSGVTYLDYTHRSDDDISRLAQQKYETLYLKELETARRATEGNAGRIQQTLSALEPYYEQRSQDTVAQYAQQKQNISDSTMARGFGRSTYTTDMLARSDIRQQGALDTLTREKASRIDELTQQINGLYSQLEETEGRLTVEKQNNILNAIEDMKKEQETERKNVLKYNNELTLRQAEEQAKAEREAREYALKLQEMEQTNYWKGQDMLLRQQQLDHQMQQASQDYNLRANASQLEAEKWAWQVEQARAEAAQAAALSAQQQQYAEMAAYSAVDSGAKSTAAGSTSSKSGSSSTSKGSSGTSKSSSSTSSKASSSKSTSTTSSSSSYTSTASNKFLYNELKSQLDRMSKQQALVMVQTDAAYKQLGGDYYKLVDYVKNR